jgi:hypothetical protein
MKRTVVIPDLQVPYHDPVAVKNVAAYIKAVRPDSVVTLGDARPLLVKQESPSL